MFLFIYFRCYRFWRTKVHFSYSVRLQEVSDVYAINSFKSCHSFYFFLRCWYFAAPVLIFFSHDIGLLLQLFNREKTIENFLYLIVFICKFFINYYSKLQYIILLRLFFFLIMYFCKIPKWNCFISNILRQNFVLISMKNGKIQLIVLLYVKRSNMFLLCQIVLLI